MILGNKRLVKECETCGRKIIAQRGTRRFCAKCMNDRNRNFASIRNAKMKVGGSKSSLKAYERRGLHADPFVRYAFMILDNNLPGDKNAFNGNRKGETHLQQIERRMKEVGIL